MIISKNSIIGCNSLNVWCYGPMKYVLSEYYQYDKVDMSIALQQFNYGEDLYIVSTFVSVKMINDVRCSLSMKDLII